MADSWRVHKRWVGCEASRGKLLAHTKTLGTSRVGEGVQS